METSHNQVLRDNRKPKEKEKDFSHKELAFSAVPPEYSTKKFAKSQIGKYFAENQKSTGSCVAHSAALCAGILEEIEGKEYQRFSPAFIYRQRKNYPSMGMYVVDSGELLRKYGCPFRDYCETPATEAEINNIFLTGEMYDKAKPYRAGSYITIYSKNIDDYVQVINNVGLPISLNVWGSKEEWSKEVPMVLDPKLKQQDAFVQHEVVILPNTGYIDRGVKYVIVQDSAHFGGKTHRHLSEDWFKHRVVMGLYWLTLPNPVDEPYTFKHTFNRDLKVGDKGAEVKKMQEALKSLGFFPQIECTGAFFGITRKAVEDFQKKYERDILTILGLKKPTGYFGAKTRQKLNQIINANN